MFSKPDSRVIYVRCLKREEKEEKEENGTGIRYRFKICLKLQCHCLIHPQSLIVFTNLDSSRQNDKFKICSKIRQKLDACMYDSYLRWKSVMWVGLCGFRSHIKIWSYMYAQLLNVHQNMTVTGECMLTDDINAYSLKYLSDMQY